MKKVLITGANSYIGTSFESYIKEKFPNDYVIDTIDMVDGSWREKSFVGYDSIFHVAGIAHSDNGRISKEKEKLYYEVNTDLTIAVAKKAKLDGVGQFVFMSSAIVYGNSAPLGKEKVITKDTPVSPSNCYGDSKVQAENGILSLSNEKFNVVIIRSPMIYGKGCKGNYPILVKFAKKLPFFPLVTNSRSMIYIENLSEFIRLMIANGEHGIFWPQNAEYSNTSQMVKMIAEVYGQNIRLTKLFNWCLPVARLITGLIDKAFGNLCYEQGLSSYQSYTYQVVSLQESIRRTKE